MRKETPNFGIFIGNQMQPCLPRVLAKKFGWKFRWFNFDEPLGVFKGSWEFWPLSALKIRFERFWPPKARLWIYNIYYWGSLSLCNCAPPTDKAKVMSLLGSAARLSTTPTTPRRREQSKQFAILPVCANDSSFGVACGRRISVCFHHSRQL